METSASRLLSKLRAPRTLWPTWRFAIGMDLRSLALFRVALAAVILGDLFWRAGDLRAFYTDFGVMPRSFLLAKFLSSSSWSLYLLNGSAFFAGLLFFGTALCAVGLLIGYRTRLMTFLAWIFMVSLHTRNVLVLQGGDVYLRLLLFWSLFLPLGDVYSVDRALGATSQKRPLQWVSVGTLALLLQIIMVYVCSAGFKWRAWDWQTGTAIFFALNIDQFSTCFTSYFLKCPTLLHWLTPVVLYVELVVPMLFLVPVAAVRLVCVLMLAVLHIGFMAALRLGPFPYVCITALLSLLPALFWDRCKARTAARQAAPLRVYYDGECGFCHKMVLLIKEFLLLSNAVVMPAQTDAAVHEEMKQKNSWVVIGGDGTHFFKFPAMLAVLRYSPLLFWLVPILRMPFLIKAGDGVYAGVARHRSLFGRLTRRLRPQSLAEREARWSETLAAVCLVSVIWWNYVDMVPDSYRLPGFVRKVCAVLRLDQRWSMFAPSPHKQDGWYVMPAKFKDGKQLDVFWGKAVTWERPASVADQYKNERWRKFMMNLFVSKNEDHLRHYARYLCRAWNERLPAAQQLDTFEIDFMMEEILPTGQLLDAEKWNLLTHSCSETAPKK